MKDKYKYKSSKIVYAIRNNVTKQIKIGVSDNVRNRISSLVCSSGCEMEILYTSDYFTNSLEVERLCHEHLKEYRKIGEWFEIDETQAIDTIKMFSCEGEPDKIVQMYRNGDSIYKILLSIDVSRTTCVNKLTHVGEWSGDWKRAKSQTAKRAENKKETIFNPSFKRIDKNMYYSEKQNTYLYMVYSEGGFKEYVFNSVDDMYLFAIK